MEPLRPFFFAACALAGGLLAACDVAPPPAVSNATPAPASSPAYPASAAQPDIRQRQMAFLNRIREADPDQTTIDRALINERNELGLILDRRVDMDKIPDLMKVMLTQMAGEFPGQDLTVIAYAPMEPPRKIGTARLNASTGNMTYTAEDQ
jgi:hypothetical protein